MRYLYLYLEIVLYVIAGIFYFVVFSGYKYVPLLEKKIDNEIKTPLSKDILFFSIFAVAIILVFFIWFKLFPGQTHRLGYFLVFLPGSVVVIAFMRKWVRRTDLVLCIPGMIVVWLFLLLFESILLTNQAGWIYTGSTVYSLRIGPHVEIILENLIYFYLISPFVSVLIFTGIAYNRSDKTAFWITNALLWIGGVVWEYAGIGIFNLWYMIENRSVLPFSLFNARTTLEEMLYYVPFASISILMYLKLYYRKYKLLSPGPEGQNK